MHAVKRSDPLPSARGRSLRGRTRSLLAAVLWLVCCAAAGAASWSAGVRALISDAPRPAGARVEVELGHLDPRLELAPCARITPYLPNGARLWGRTHVGLRCDQGARWNVFVPVTVKVFASGWAATQALPAGTVLQAGHLQLEEVDLAAESGPLIRNPEAAVGRTLARALRPGQAVREADLKARQWFAAGDTVRVVTVGAGFAVTASGQALSPGIEGHSAKVRLDGGRVVSGRATALRRVEVVL